MSISKCQRTRFWYWNDVKQDWSTEGREHGTGYKTRREAEDAAFLAAAIKTDLGSPIGNVRTSRQFVRVIEALNA